MGAAARFFVFMALGTLCQYHVLDSDSFQSKASGPLGSELTSGMR